MRSERGFTLMEAVVVMGIVGVLAAVVIPSVQIAIDRNRVFTTTDLVAGQIRSARLAAITRNTSFRVIFDCPVAGAMRMVEFFNDPAIDADPDRCTNDQPNDGPVIYMPPGVTFGNGATPPTLRVNGRGEFTAEGGSMPQNISVTYESHTRTVNVTAAGRVRTPNS
jgi:prepilin-type N-terminal cleavage/methylation domain-containing protein